MWAPTTSDQLEDYHKKFCARDDVVLTYSSDEDEGGELFWGKRHGEYALTEDDIEYYVKQIKKHRNPDGSDLMYDGT